ncbi:NAD(P)/FAD-dependent oxidoreductase [Robertkochia aurantiaca]|uniref:NAD(P)/FAD-dependent oxidoreductase n=1 Tax=Robertkochia aurantiaca TaxID=2873700 RepID=UPI001CCAD77F|nr:FAD-dependent oxidoreductase [Robertkochia sp. 3YJGBD-33]
MIDCIVVGSGLAGISFCEELRKNGKTFMVFDNDSQVSTNIAGGLYNPVILKRFTPVWKAEEQLDTALPFYAALESLLGEKFDHKIPVYRRFTSVEEQNNWFVAGDKPGLSPFIETSVHHFELPGVEAPFGYGRVLQTGRVDTEALQKAYVSYLQDTGCFRQESFQYDRLQVMNDRVIYDGIEASRVIFCEGFGMKKNPFFDYLPLNGTKGELLIIEAPELELDFVLKSSVFLIPLGERRYKVGATYKWKDKTNIPTEESRMELLTKLQSFFKGPYEVIDHVAGIRPTVADRRPLVGQHPEFSRLYCLNGLGSRGVMIAPFAAKQLYQSMYGQQEIVPEMDVERYRSKYQSTVSG